MVVRTHPSRAAYRIRPIHIHIRIPRIYIEIRRKDLWASAFILLSGLAIPALMVLEVLPLALPLFFLGFFLVLMGGVLFLIRSGEIA